MNIDLKQRKVYAGLCLVMVLTAGCSGPHYSEDSSRQELEKARAGDFVSFGCYPQNPDRKDDAQPLEWIVLDKKPDRLLLLSRYVIALEAFQRQGKKVTWADSDLRESLNGDFLESAFTPNERGMILEVSNDTTKNPDRGTPGGGKTDDYVFLLCQEDIDYYMYSDYTRWEFGSAQATGAAAEAGVYVDDENGCSPWWLRSPGYDEYSIQFVEPDGTRYSPGANADINYYYGVRPALWVNTEGKS